MATFKLNGRSVNIEVDPNETLLSVLRDDFAVNGSKFGCGKSQCGACTVLVDGDPLRACVAPVSAVLGRSVVTLEGLSEGGHPSRLQQAFMDEQAAQCGYCTSGMILMSQALLERNPNPSDQEVRQALDSNLCRCGSHNRIVRAVIRASRSKA